MLAQTVAVSIGICAPTATDSPGLPNRVRGGNKVRKLGLFAAALALPVLLATGCGGSGGSTGAVSISTVSDESKECSRTPQQGGSLVYAVQNETVTLNPYALISNGDIFVDEMIYAGLVRMNPEGGAQIVPALAKSWDISPDGKTYTFHLRPAKFSDGTPVTAEDVQFSLDNFGDPKINVVLGVLGGGYEKTEIVSPSTVRVHLSKPVASFLYNLSVVAAAIVPKKQVEQEGEAFWKNPVGAGPFTMKDFVQGSHVTLNRNPHYWDEGKPYVDSLRFNYAADSNSRMLALKNGQAQIADGVPFSQIESLQADSTIQVQSNASPAWINLSFNTKRPELDDQNVRTAISHALNREQIIDQIFHGVATIPNSMLGEFDIDAPDSVVEPAEYSVEKAKEFMAKSNFPDGFSTTLHYPAGYEFQKQLTLLIQQELAAIGIKVKLVELDQTSNTEQFYAGEYDMAIAYPYQNSDIPVPDEYAGFYALPSSELNGFATWWSDPEVQRMVEKFLGNMDEAERAEEWSVIQKEFLAQSPSINVVNVPPVTAHQSSVCGAVANALGLEQLQLAWLAAPES